MTPSMIHVPNRVAPGSANPTFRYLGTLHIVTVEATAAGATKKGGDLEEDLLVNLFPGDTGADTPNVGGCTS
jgi:hypothetical protein